MAWSILLNPEPQAGPVLPRWLAGKQGFSACSSSQQEKNPPPKFFQAAVTKPQHNDRHFPGP